MKKNDVRATVRRVKKEYRLNKVGSEDLKRIIQDQGFTVIDFIPESNDGDVEIIVQRLDLFDYLRRLKGFTYSDTSFHLVFVRADLNESEKAIVLAHEAGHILCNHLGTNPMLGSSVTEEMEANQFTTYLLTQSVPEKVGNYVASHKAAVISVVVAAFILLGAGAWVIYRVQESKYYGDYYVTEHGEKYHQRDCPYIKDRTNVHRLTKEEYESGEFSPCQVCLPSQA